MELFQLDNYQVMFAPQTMMITEFAAIRDKNNDNDLTLKEMSYIWFFADTRSDFKQILDTKEREEEIKHSIGLDPDWTPSTEVLNAIDYYQEYSKTPSSGLYEASVVTAQYIEKQLKKPEALLALEDKKGTPMYKLDTLIRIMKDVPDVMDKLHKAREQVLKELDSKSELKGGKSKALYEDGI